MACTSEPVCSGQGPVCALLDNAPEAVQRQRPPGIPLNLKPVLCACAEGADLVVLEPPLKQARLVLQGPLCDNGLSGIVHVVLQAHCPQVHQWLGAAKARAALSGGPLLGLPRSAMGPTSARCLHFPPMLFTVSLQQCQLFGQAHIEMLLLSVMSRQKISRTLAAVHLSVA